MELLGVYDSDLIEPMAKVLCNLGVKSGMVVYGQDGLDEISLSSATSVCELRDGDFRSYTLEPEEFGFTRCQKEELSGGTPAENAKITCDILSGAKGPRRDAVLLNSAAAIHIARPDVTLKDGIALAAETIDSGKAQAQLEQFITLSRTGGKAS
jgi:anthranilate phosphoribosyltransferase